MTTSRRGLKAKVPDCRIAYKFKTVYEAPIIFKIWLSFRRDMLKTQCYILFMQVVPNLFYVLRISISRRWPSSSIEFSLRCEPPLLVMTVIIDDDNNIMHDNGKKYKFSFTAFLDHAFSHLGAHNTLKVHIYRETRQ